MYPKTKPNSECSHGALEAWIRKGLVDVCNISSDVLDSGREDEEDTIIKIKRNKENHSELKSAVIVDVEYAKVRENINNKVLFSFDFHTFIK